jgi:DNA polymerase
MGQALHIDIETYSPVDLKKSGSYRYFEDFELLIAAYAFGDGPVRVADCAQGEELPPEFLEALQDPWVEKWAHNANFERCAFKALGYDIPAEQWRCSATKAAYCGLPLSLEAASQALMLGDKGKDPSGKRLIKFFSVPCKPTKANGERTRNLPGHAPEKWEVFKEYCRQDVIAEREIKNRLSAYEETPFERKMYALDQQINDTGIEIDLSFAEMAMAFGRQYASKLERRMREITGVENPNSPAQLKSWLSEAMQKEVKSLAKDALAEMLDRAEAGPVRDVLELRKRLAKTSIKKYAAMKKAACRDGRARGLFRFYGASRTGRWAGRLIQLQNLPRNYLPDLEAVRGLVKSGDYKTVSLLFGNVSDVLSQLIRTSFVAAEGCLFAVADFSAVEARVTAWVAGQEWRMDVFKTHGKIYEASASFMFGVPIEQITKGSELRMKGKVAELALGYQGGVGAMKTMGGEQMGLSEAEMRGIVDAWRAKSPDIVNFWAECDKLAKKAVAAKRPYASKSGLFVFDCDKDFLTIKLPSGRKLFYREPKIAQNKWGRPAVWYKGINQSTRKWGYLQTYGGKLTENIVQAVARDLLAEAMMAASKAGYRIVMHVHDEIVAEVKQARAQESLEELERIMSQAPAWAAGLPLAADGYLTPFYKKD